MSPGTGFIAGVVAGVLMTVIAQWYVLTPLMVIANTQQQIVEKVFPKLQDLERRLDVAERPAIMQPSPTPTLRQGVLGGE